MTAMTYCASRVVWLWCVAYTAVAPRASRDRRRGEIRSHLWESEQARLAPAAVLLAAARGIGADLLWSVSRGIPPLVRSFGTPTPYVALAPAFPIQGWIVSSVAAGSGAHASEALGAAGGGAMLAVAGLIWLARRT
jgi:hypothetical protein